MNLQQYWRIVLFLCWFCFITPVIAMECPQVNTGTFFHQTSPVIESSPWLMDVQLSAQGWYVVNKPSSEHSTQKVVSPDSDLTVTLQKGGNGKFYFICDYFLEPGEEPITLTVSNNMPHMQPINPRFTKVSDTKYVCVTKNTTPRECEDADIRPVICGLGHSC